MNSSWSNGRKLTHPYQTAGEWILDASANMCRQKSLRKIVLNAPLLWVSLPSSMLTKMSFFCNRIRIGIVMVWIVWKCSSLNNAYHVLLLQKIINNQKFILVTYCNWTSEKEFFFPFLSAPCADIAKGFEVLLNWHFILCTNLCTDKLGIQGNTKEAKNSFENCIFLIIYVWSAQIYVVLEFKLAFCWTLCKSLCKGVPNVNK